MTVISLPPGSLTIGEVAGLISGTISILVHVIPLSFAFVLVGIIRDRQLDAATWSAVSRTLQSTQWPVILQSDGAVGNLKGKKIRWRVFLISQCGLLAALCLIIAHFLTPKPLVEVVKRAKSLQDVDFVYAQDSSYFGQATLDPQPEPICRRCGHNKWMDCPNSIYNVPEIRNQYPNMTVVNSTIPHITKDIFTSGTKNGSVASPMDIQFRAYTLVNNSYVDNYATRPLGRLENLPSLVVDEGYHVIEGLIVDSKQGGVGIRNHTVPLGLTYGATWSEDILWIMPETKCTNTNLTLHFSVTNNVSKTFAGDYGYLQDDGGFFGISSAIPSPRWDDLDPEWSSVGPIPNLQRNADIMAWWNNQFVAQTLRLNSSAPGTIYRDQFDQYGWFSDPAAMKISPVDGMFMNDLAYNERYEIKKNFNEYAIRCTGYHDDDPNASGKAFVKCGYHFSLPRPEYENEGQSWRPDPGSSWKQNLYTCSSSVTVGIRNVTFSTNGSTALEALQVLNVQEKDLNETDMPTWGIENVDRTRYKIYDIYKFWGLIDKSYSNYANVDVHHGPQIYLPSAEREVTLGRHVYDSFAAGAAFTAAWQSVYEWAASDSTSAENNIPNYSGKLNYGLTLRWRQLSGSTIGAAKLLNLIWTDLVAFTIIGTRTGFESPGEMANSINDKTKALGQRQVYRYESVIEYNDIRYAIPVFIAIGLFIISFTVALAMFCCQPHSWRALNHYMNQTNMGRAMTQIILRHEPDRISPYARTSVWVQKARTLILDVPEVKKRTTRQSRSSLSRRSPAFSDDSTTTIMAEMNELRSSPYEGQYHGDYLAVPKNVPGEERSFSSSSQITPGSPSHTR